MAVSVARVEQIDPEEYLGLLQRSTLALRRPVDQPDLIAAALAGSNLVVEARDGEVLVGAARAVTDFHLTCYLADLAVDQHRHRSGIGLALQRELRAHLGPACRIKLAASPAASEYYPRLGYERIERGWELSPGTPLG
ncbi:GNAT family N-acetyltransferase [Demequina globuliformis]|uniref:GNAT family N-acetyltransferase n=1 Tax=Demequina globuliformis TaxID=676202 RepID=UPI00078408FA|nr:GNAT family N-acetyltransferase [Demequina globuliformis]